MLPIAYFRAKVRFDTAENEPTNNLQSFAKQKLAKVPGGRRPHQPRRRALRRAGRGAAGPEDAVG